MRQDSEHALSVLKSNSFVLKWKRVVSVLTPLSLFSRGGSQMSYDSKSESIFRLPVVPHFSSGIVGRAKREGA